MLGFCIKDMSVHMEYNGPAEKKTVFNEDGKRISSATEQTTIDGMVPLEHEEAASRIEKATDSLQDFYAQLAGLNNSEFNVTDTDAWTASLSGPNETRPVAIAADNVAEQREDINALTVLISWSRDNKFPFSEEAGFIAEKASSYERTDNIKEFYDEELI